MNGTYSCVIDRIVDGETAVLLVEDGDEIVEQLDLPVERVPVDGRHEGAVFRARFDEGSLAAFHYRPQREATRREAAQDRFDSLSERLGDE